MASLGVPFTLTSDTSPLTDGDANLAATKASSSSKFLASSSLQQSNTEQVTLDATATAGPLLTAVAVQAANTATTHNTLRNEYLPPGESKDTRRPQTQTQQLQQLQNAAAAKLKYSSDRDRVRWNSTPTAEPHRGAVSKEGEVQPPTPKPFEPSFPSIIEDVGQPTRGGSVHVTTSDIHRHLHQQHLLHGSSPLASPALSTMTTGSSGWHQWNDDGFDYEAVAELTGSSKHEEGSKTDQPEALTREKLLEFQAAVHSGNPHSLVQSMHSLGGSMTSLGGSAIEDPHHLHQSLGPRRDSGTFLAHQPHQPHQPLQPPPLPRSQPQPVLSRQNQHPPQTRVVVYKAGSRFGEPTGAGQLMTIPTKASKFMKPHEASILFDEFLYDAAVRLGFAKVQDPLVAPPSPSRRRRVSILGNEIKRLETDLDKGRYVDPTFLNGLKNKMEILRLGDEAAAATRSKHTKGSSSFVSALRNAAAVEDEAPGQQQRTIDVSRLSLWHSKYKAQIRDFSSIRDGDALLLRSMDDKDSSSSTQASSPKRTTTTIRADVPTTGAGATLEELVIEDGEDGGSTILEDSHGGSVLGLVSKSIGSLDSVGSMDSMQQRESPGRRVIGDSDRKRRSSSSGMDGMNGMEEAERREDNLRLRRIGLSQLLDAIKSQRTLFGKRLKGAKQAFAAIDRDKTGTITASDLQKAMKRLDIKLSAAAVHELVELLQEGSFMTESQNGHNGSLRVDDFIDLLHTVNEQEEEGGNGDGRDWLGAGGGGGMGGLSGGFSQSMQRSSISQSRSLMQKRQRPRKRKRRHHFREDPLDARPDEELMWDIESNPEDPQPLQSFAERLIVRGQPTRAQSYLKRALLMAEREAAASFGGSSSSTANTTSVYAADGSMIMDMEDNGLQKYTALHALRLELMQRLGTLYALDEHFGAAQQMYEEAVQLAPLSLTEYINVKASSSSNSGLPSTKADPLALLGALLERLREYDKAEEAYLRALAIDPEHAASLLRMANLLADVRGDTKGSSSYYERAMMAANQDYNDADIPLKIGRRRMLDTYRCYATFKHRVAGDFEGSLLLLRAAMAVPTPRTDRLSSAEMAVKRRQNPAWKPKEHQDKAAIMCAMGKVELARLADNPHLEASLSDPSALASDGSIDRRQGGSVLGAIVELFEKSLEAEPNHIDTKLELALLLSQRSKSPKDRNTATELFEHVLSVDDNNCRALLGLAQHLDFTG